MGRDRLDTYLRFVKPYYKDKDPAHDIRHIQRIIRRLPQLSAGMTPEPQQDILYFLACFHGLGNKIKAEPGFADAVTKFLHEIGWNADEIDDLFLRLERHLVSPVTVEEQIVHDANYMELLGAFGIAKAFTKGGAEGQSYEETADIYEYQYLDRVEFKTPAGRQFAIESRSFAKEFLKRLRAEL